MCCSHNASCLLSQRRVSHQQQLLADYSYDDIVEQLGVDENNAVSKTQPSQQQNSNWGFLADSNNGVHDTGQRQGSPQPSQTKHARDGHRRGRQGLSRNLHLKNHGSRGNNRRKDLRRRSYHRRSRGAGNNNRGGGWRSNEDLTFSLRDQG